MIVLSCVNCCHNPLQTDSVGMQVGYCTEHKTVLLAASHLTCGQHLRKDLVAPRAIEQRTFHERRFSPSMVVRLTEPRRPANGGYTSVTRADTNTLAADQVADAVLDYGRLESKIASLAQLRRVPNARAEIALLSLGRAYVNRCFVRDKRWTSGIHLVWWTRRNLLEIPSIDVADLRTESPAPLARQTTLAQWSLIMMRLILISDVAFYARDEDKKFAHLADLADLAADKTRDLSPRRLITWLAREGTKIFDAALTERRYETIATELRQARDSDL